MEISDLISILKVNLHWSKYHYWSIKLKFFLIAWSTFSVAVLKILTSIITSSSSEQDNTSSVLQNTVKCLRKFAEDIVFLHVEIDEIHWFINDVIFRANRPNISRCWWIKCEDLLLFFLSYIINKTLTKTSARPVFIAILRLADK